MTTARAPRPLLAFMIAAALLAPFLFYFQTERSIVDIWNSSETFAHGYIILPISLWLIWRRRDVLRNMEPSPWWPGLLLLAGCGFGWLLAQLGDVQVVRQYSFAALIPLAALTVLGRRIATQLAFPLAFILFAVPFGEIFVEPLINFTADFTVAALQATGIPVLRDGSRFSIPTGDWSVVEACSGVRYLISSVTLGCLYAYLTYRSRLRQAAFVAISIIVPIIANGLRAYMIVMIGHLSGMQYAVGFDHLIYGWVFFGVVMFLMFWIGSFWREDDDKSAKTEEASASPAAAPAPAIQPVSQGRMAAACAAVIACLGIWPAYAEYLEHAGFNPQTAKLDAFSPRWEEVPAFVDWKPSFFPANAEMLRFFRSGERQVGVSMLYYRNQQHGAELISSTNKLVGDQDTRWHRAASGGRIETIGGQELRLRESRLQGPAGPMLVWHWYWIDQRFTTNDYLGKLLQARSKLLMRGDDSASVMVFTPYADHADEARAALRDFLEQNLASIETTLSSNKAQAAQ